MTNVDHKVAIHQLAATRRAAGQPVWAHRIRLGDLFHNDETTFEQKRDGFVRIMKNSKWFTSQEPFSELDEYLDGAAHADDADEFDYWLSEIYDLADYDRVWINR
jgi:hypothetical protein